MAVTREMLLSELKDLLRLTAFEQTVATVRRAQARTTPIERELAENAVKAGERLALLRSAVAQVGGVPDVVNPLLGKAGAFVQTQVNQVQTLQGALLGDLALEHQLRERARYARTLAQTLGETSVLPVLDRLDVAHTATIEWLEMRLAEVGRTGTSALGATPVQVVVSVARTTAATPLSVLFAGVNRAGGLLGKLSGRAPQPVQDVLRQLEDAARTAADTAVDTARSVAGTVVQKAEDAEETVEEAVIDLTDRAKDAVDETAGPAQPPPAPTGEQAAELTEQVLEASGGADVADDKPPFAGYERLTGDSVMRHVADSDDVDEVRTVLAFEQAHKARKGVLQTAQQRLEELVSL